MRYTNNEAIAAFNAIEDAIKETGVEVEEGTKVRLLANKIPEVYDKATNDFWDNYLNNYANTMGLFAGYGWNDETFKPNKDIVITGFSPYIFYYSKIVDLSAKLKECNVALKCGTASNLQSAFAYSAIISIPYIDLTTVTNYSTIFANASRLETIEGIKFANNVVFSNTFSNCTSLKNITIDGTIEQNGFDMRNSTKLTAKSLYSIINALSATTTGLSITLPTTAEANYNANVPTGAPATWAELVATKGNWTIVYA